MAERFFLIDAHSQIYRSFYAIRGLSAPGGQATNATYGFTTFLLKVLREEQPDFLAVAFDEREETFRRQRFAAYKAQREAMPEELASQIPWIRRIVQLLGVQIVSKPRYEADDVIGTLATQAADRGLDVHIATSDKDVLQLLGPRTFVYTKDYATYDEAALRRDKGISPQQVVELMALSGDSSDNVPGVRGVGPKTAEKLIRQFGTIDNLYANLDQVKNVSLREKLRAAEQDARLSRDLVVLDTAVPLDVELQDLKPAAPAREELVAVFSELGFRKLRAEFAKDATATSPAVPAESSAEPEQETIVPMAEFDTKYQIVGSMAEVAHLAGELGGLPALAVDLETTSRQPHSAEIVGLSFSWQEGEGAYVPLMAPIGQQVLPREEALAAVRPILEDERIEKWGQNLKYDLQVLRRAGIPLRGLAFDTMVASYVLDPLRRRHNLDDLSEAWLGLRKTPTEALIGKGKDQITMDRVDLDAVARYACEDTDAVVRLVHALAPKLKEQACDDLFRRVEMPLVEVLADMEYAGVRIDPDVLARMSEEIAGELDVLAQEIHEDAGEVFNIDSPKQLQVILFDKWKLKPLRKTKTGYSTNAAVLEELAVNDPRPAKIMHYRQLGKLKGTYLDALPKLIHRRTGRVHTSFNQTVTATGRLSSSDPNLQNIPIRTDIGRRIRSAFVPGRREEVLLTADYSQIELRIVAHLSQDPSLVQAFQQDQDIHAFVASQVFDEPIGAVTPAQRRVAKAVNFGIIYGLTPYGLSRQLGIPVSSAKEYIDSYFERYAQVKKYTEQVIAQARVEGYVSTLLGRRRLIPEINSSNDTRRKLAERTAINTVAQGTAADMIKVAMVSIFNRIRSERRPAKLLLQIHDELLFEVPRDALDAEQEMIRTEMAGALPLSVPVKVDMAAGENWLEAGENK